MKKEKATQAAQNKTPSFKDNSGASQRARVIEALRSGPKNTLELRADWGVLMPAPRIFELNERGWQISKISVKAATPDGVLHSGIARYFIVKELSAANDPIFLSNDGRTV
jgi:hypothetical protein